MEAASNKEYLKELLVNLKKPVPHKWRVQSFSKVKPKATVMAYIDARQAQEVLDAYCEYGWHRKHYTIDGKIYCEVGISMPDGTIQWRGDCGTESQSDAEKGQSSDSFKRACVNFGIGRFLYDMPIKYVDADAIKGKADSTDKKIKVFPNPIDEQGNRIWDMTIYINSKNPNQPAAPKSVTAELPAEEDRRPWITAKMLTQAIDKIKGGQKDVFDKTIKAFQIKPEQLTQLKSVA